MTNHAIRQAKIREIHPDLVYNVLKTGKVSRFGKHLLRFVGKSIACIGQDLGHVIIIKTVERIK